MDICASSASLLEEELASAIEPAVKAAVLSVMSAITRFVDRRCAVLYVSQKEREKEFQSVRLRLEIAERELEAVRKRDYLNTNKPHSWMNTNIIHLAEKEKEENRLKRASFFSETADKRARNTRGSGSLAHGLPAITRNFSTFPVQPVRDPVPAVHTALKNPRVLIQEDGSYSEQDLLMRGDDSEQRDHTSTAGWRRALKGPAERNALPHAEEGSKAESLPIQEELFDQEWCRSPKQATELTSIEGEVKPALDPVHIKEEASELEPVHVNEEISGIECVVIKEEVLELESHPIEEGGPEYFERRQQIHAGQNVHLCTVCGKSFSRSAELKRHHRIHTGERPYPCTDCGKSFGASTDLKRHLQIHTRQKLYHCTQCGKGFTHSGTLALHQRIHTGEKPYSCTECGKSFTHSATLSLHQRIHTGENLYQCSECSKTFIASAELKRHQRIHTGEKPYRCTECGKSFKQMPHLKTHQQIHTGEKPYCCTACGKSFTFHSQLKKHTESSHAVRHTP
ncbi:zinc finger protein 12-like isoform X2 [Acipenser ruthenus]|uniref:zinc finger protein 12-like isoform X2 n=1 Tax=Acipenser ruthenus TaxID=7906 RepID=UPI002740DA72|nr:zinc finger protein 12-like isoform X2 [Acipenser ruthenus]